MPHLKITHRVLPDFWSARAPESGRSGEDHSRFNVPIGIALAGDGESTGPLDASLIEMIEGEIIPRLLLSHRGESAAFALPDFDDDAPIIPRPIIPQQDSPGSAPVGHDRFAGIADCAKFARLLVEQDIEMSWRHVDVLRSNPGISDSAILLEFLAPTARELGRMWEEDLCSFADVTVGICALERLMMRMRQGIAADDVPLVDVGAPSTGATALLTVCPGEQHGFGLLMVQEFFRRAGWDVHCGPYCTAESLIDEVQRNSYALIGLSLSDADGLEGCASLIASIRAASRNRDVVVFVGGYIFSEHPERALLVGADDTAEDGETAVLKAGRLLGMTSGARRLDS